MAYEQILVRITGKDRIGLTAAFTGILAKYDAQILDIGQADIHSTLSLGLASSRNMTPRSWTSARPTSTPPCRWVS